MSAARHSELIPTLLALGLVTLSSLLGSVSFALGKRLSALVPYLMSAAAGALLGTALYALLPEALERSPTHQRVGFLLIAGLVLSFLFERLLKTLLGSDKENHAAGSALTTNILFGGALHSLVDGIAIAVAFSASHKAGVATAAAVLLHEVPHHIADVGVLIYSGLPRGRALVLNLLATSGCAIGGVLVLLFGTGADSLTTALLPITAANLLYISVGMLMPELQRERSQTRAYLQMLILVVSVLVVAFWGQLIPNVAWLLARIMR